MSLFLVRIKNRWQEDGGYSEVLEIAIPLIISTGTWSVLHFVDRMFLSWYSQETIAAAMPAGLLSFTITSVFIGTASYIGTFVAQYYGAKRYKRCGASLWQGIYIALIGGTLQISLLPLAGPIFDFVGHETEIRHYEITYFRILCLGAVPAIVSSTISAFFSGLGQTRPVMWVNIAAMLFNILLDWILIFGHLGFPELGIAGAGIATVCSFIFNMGIYFLWLSHPFYRIRFDTIKAWPFEKRLFTRVIRFGFPSGIQFFIDMSGITFFVLLIGKLGTVSLASTNIAFNISTLSFMPMIGTGMAISVLVGQRLGENRPEIAARSTYSALHLASVYISGIVLLYVLWPDLFVRAFSSQSDPLEFQPIRDTTVILLRFVAFYSLFDAMSIIFSSALKGAGDTRFVMFIVTLVSIFILMLPSYALIIFFSMGTYSGWICPTAYVVTLGLVFFARFSRGKWKQMRVIEKSRGIP
ncbi:MAG: MATE family efflux transporter [Desulfatiglans sp.]|jgi:MATE family multidrug resistance protein|nr:MATE family efflux transporter [Desulfatiglans sp.]